MKTLFILAAALFFDAGNFRIEDLLWNPRETKMSEGRLKLAGPIHGGA